MMTIPEFVQRLGEIGGPRHGWHLSGSSIRDGLCKCPISALVAHVEHREGWNRDYQQNALTLGLTDADARTIAAAADAMTRDYDSGVRTEIAAAVGLA